MLKRLTTCIFNSKLTKKNIYPASSNSSDNSELCQNNNYVATKQKTHPQQVNNIQELQRILKLNQTCFRNLEFQMQISQNNPAKKNDKETEPTTMAPDFSTSIF